MSVSYGGDSITFADNSTISSGWTGFKNRIINGDMRINQRALGTVSASGSCILDRFINYRSGGAYSVQQSTDAPAGFTNSMLMTNTTAASPTTFSFFGQIIEGNNIADFNFGTANASAITVSFWVKSSVAGVYSISITNGNGDRAYAATYTINNTNTWEKETITIPGDVTGTWATNNTSGMFLRINLGSPAGRTTTSGSWVGGNFDGATGSTGATTWANTLNATFYVTGVQLERGSTASSFEYRPYTTELQLCQRYYKYVDVGRSDLPITRASDSLRRMTVALNTVMRTSPTAVLGTNNPDGASSISIPTVRPEYVTFYCTGSSSSTPNISDFTVSAEL